MRPLPHPRRQGLIIELWPCLYRRRGEINIADFQGQLTSIFASPVSLTPSQDSYTNSTIFSFFFFFFPFYPLSSLSPSFHKLQFAFLSFSSDWPYYSKMGCNSPNPSFSFMSTTIWEDFMENLEKTEDSVIN